MAQGSGQFTGNFVNFTKNNVPLFTVDNNGKESCRSAAAAATCGLNYLSGGAFTIANTAIQGSDSIELSLQSCTGCGGSTYYVSSVSAGSSFTITSTGGSGDTSIVFWRIVHRN
jgi:hypothetical protein